MIKKENYSLLTYLGSIIVVTAIFVEGVFLSYYYFHTSKQLISNIQSNSEITTERLKNSLVPFIESFSVNEYEKLISNELKDQNIVAITVEDYNMGMVLGQAHFITGRIKTEQQNIIKYDEKDLEKYILGKYFFKQESTIRSSNDKALGKITIYYTDKFIDQELWELIEKSIGVALISLLILVALLYFLIKTFIVNPLDKIIVQLSSSDEMGIPKKVQTIQGPKEIETLSVSLKNMVSTIQKSKEKISQLNERYKLTFSGVDDGIWDWDLKTDQAYFSKRWKEMLGYSESEVQNNGKAFFHLIHDEDKEKVEKALKDHFKNPKKYPYNLEIRLKTKENSYKWILARGNAVLDHQKKPLRMLGFHTDITLKKEEEQRKQEQEQFLFEQAKLISMGEMIGNIAHQWRQPLSVISTSASGLKMKLEFFDKIEKEEVIKFSNLIVQQTEFLSKTITNFTDFIKGDSNFTNISIKKVIEEALILSSASLQNNYINLIEDIEQDLIIFGNKNELTEAFVNIINNSKDILKEKIDQSKDRFLFVTTRKVDGNTINIMIKDSGGGIDEAIIHRVFEPYFTTKHQSVGTGLGLSICDKIIRERHHGSITVENVEYIHNDKNYKGSCFIIELSSKK